MHPLITAYNNLRNCELGINFTTPYFEQWCSLTECLMWYDELVASQSIPKSFVGFYYWTEYNQWATWVWGTI